MLKRGFTLIEILIVISIIGMMSTLLLPNISGAQNKAKEAGVKAAAHTLQTSIETYNIDYFHYPKGSNLSVYELANILIDEGYLRKIPTNPFTGESYAASDEYGKIIYSYDEQSNEYSLTAYKADGETILAEISNI